MTRQHIKSRTMSEGRVRYKPIAKPDWLYYTAWQDHCPHAITIQDKFYKTARGEALVKHGQQNSSCNN